MNPTSLQPSDGAMFTCSVVGPKVTIKENSVSKIVGGGAQSGILHSERGEYRIFWKRFMRERAK